MEPLVHIVSLVLKLSIAFNFGIFHKNSKPLGVVVGISLVVVLDDPFAFCLS